MLLCVLTQYSGHGQSDLLLVLFEHLQFVLQLLGRLQGHGEHQEGVVHPGHDTLGLVAVETRDALV